jgi:hypothetical protein
MKTQISNLRSGTKNQILNPSINYSDFKKSTSHLGHSGTNHEDVKRIWERVVSENPEKMTAIINGVTVELSANWSLSRKTVTYTAIIPKEVLENKFFIKASEKKTPYISIQGGNLVVVSNGKRSYKYICPSLVTIL